MVGVGGVNVYACFGPCFQTFRVTRPSDFPPPLKLDLLVGLVIYAVIEVFVFLSQQNVWFRPAFGRGT